MKAWSDAKYQKAFDMVRHRLTEAIWAYAIFKKLHNPDLQKLYDDQLYFWSAIIGSLRSYVLLNLATVFEESKHTSAGKTASIRSLIDYRVRAATELKVIDKLMSMLEKPLSRLKDHRDKSLTHNDLKPSKTELFYGDIDDVLDCTEQLLHILDPHGKGHHYSFKSSLELTDRDVEKVLKSLLEKVV